ncbi:MAG: hypothetical protein GX596_11475 [Propionibacterium sp.]|nr:hypothetical protein [Propionibacterium sp.]
MATVDSVSIWERARWRTLAHLIACTAAGVLAGVAWAALSPRAHYLIDEDLRALLSERQHAEIIGGDAAFTLIVGLFGLAIGILTWVWFHRRGWLVIALGVLGPVILAVVAWQVGEMVGGSGLTDRLATASPGDLVQMDLELHSLSALAAAPFFAITPIMLLAAFLPERFVDGDKRRRRAR